MGMADLVPGVSGGTMAFILGIYERLLAAIRSFDKAWVLAFIKLDVREVVGRPHFSFILPLLVGLFGAVFFFTRVISLPGLIKDYPEHVYGLFFGLILASIIVLMKELKGFCIKDALTLMLGTAGGLLLVNMVPVATPDSGWFIFVTGSIAICAMILPGISGSFLLLIMKKYSTILQALGDLNLSVILPFVLGCITGLVLFSRFLDLLLRHFYQRTLLVIKGILLASLWILWPFQQRVYETISGKQKLLSSQPFLPMTWDSTVIEVAGLGLIGICVVLVFNAFSRR